MNELRRAVERLADLGFMLVKLKPNTKQPADGFGWQQRATNDNNEIHSWRGAFNVGILGGSKLVGDRSLLVVDVDDKNGKHGSASLRQLEAEFGELPRTATALTPTGGKHLYLTVPTGLPLVGISQRLAKTYPGVELLGTGLFAVAPPSTIDGRNYDWYIFPEEGLSEAPSWLLSLLRPPGRTELLKSDGRQRRNSEGLSEGSAQTELVRETIKRFQVFGPGQRNDRMHRAVASLFAKQLSPPLVREIMIEWHREFVEQIGTPFDAAEKLLDQCIASTQKKIEAGVFIPAGAVDHTKVCARKNLTPRQVEQLNRCLPRPLCPAVAYAATSAPSPLTSKGGRELVDVEDLDTKNGSENLTRQESAFVLAFILHSVYELAKGKGATLGDLPATKSQLLALMNEKFGILLDGHGPQYRRLRQKFVNKGSHKATRYALVEMVTEGRRGYASRYKWLQLQPLLSRFLDSAAEH